MSAGFSTYKFGFPILSPKSVLGPVMSVLGFVAQATLREGSQTNEEDDHCPGVRHPECPRIQPLGLRPIVPSEEVLLCGVDGWSA